MADEIAQVNRKYRRIILGIFMVCVCVGGVLIQWVFPWAMGKLAGLKPEKSLRVLQATISVMFLSILPLAWYIWSFGQKVVKSQQMPPPQTKVIKTSIIIRGKAAVVRGKALMITAALLALLGLAGGIWLPWKLGRVMADADTGEPTSREYGLGKVPAQFVILNEARRGEGSRLRIAQRGPDVAGPLCQRPHHRYGTFGSTGSISGHSRALQFSQFSSRRSRSAWSTTQSRLISPGRGCQPGCDWAAAQWSL